ncbi:MAG: hypothetical protein ACPGVA_14150 [Pikeienuella sp.]
MTKAEINEELTRLHGQLAHAPRLCQLHQQAAAHFVNDEGAVRFHLTHAWVYALVAGDEAETAQLETRLQALGGL